MVGIRARHQSPLLNHSCGTKEEDRCLSTNMLEVTMSESTVIPQLDQDDGGCAKGNELRNVVRDNLSTPDWFAPLAAWHGAKMVHDIRVSECRD